MPSPSASSVPLPTSPGSAPADTADASTTVDALIAGLRATLSTSQALVSTQSTRLSRLADLEVEHQQLKDQHAFLIAAKDAVEAQLRDEVGKREEAEERVEILRGQVESARRGVMTLQKQEKDRKRMSMMGPPAGLGLSTGTEEIEDSKEKEEKLSRRTSVRGRANYTHRRVSSQSEPETPLVAAVSSGTSPNATNAAPRTGLRELRLAPHPAGATGQLPSPLPYDDPYSSRSSPPRTSPSSEALLGARAEADGLRAELAATAARLADSEDARMASETILKALREFVGGASGVVDLNDPMTMEELRGMSLPPLPTDPDEPMPQPEQEQKKVGWGFNKLFTKSTLAVPATPGSPLSNAAEAPATPHILSPPRSVRSNSTSLISPLPTTAELPLNETAVGAMPAQTPLANFVASWTKTVPPGTPAVAAPPNATRSFSSFFRKGAPVESKEKDLPPSPVRETGSEVGSVGAERADEGKVDGLGLGLQPSPMERDAGDEEPVKAEVAGDVLVYQADKEEESEIAKEEEGQGVDSTPKVSLAEKVAAVEAEEKSAETPGEDKV